jgi:hypothetical protein
MLGSRTIVSVHRLEARLECKQVRPRTPTFVGH